MSGIIRMMIQQFLNENKNSDLILHNVTSENEFVHPTKQTSCILFIKNIQTNKTYEFCIFHQDCVNKFDKNKIIEMLNSTVGKKWVLEKKTFLQNFGEIKNLYDINLVESLTNNKTIEYSNFYTSAHLLYKNLGHNHIANHIIPFLKHKESFELFCSTVINIINSYHIDESYNKINDIQIPTLNQIEKNGLWTTDNSPVFSQYNIYTSTGRPSNRFDNVNYSALNKDDGSRNKYVSRWGKSGKMILVDYSSFHPRIICNLINFQIDPKIDIYSYLGELYFNKKDISEHELREAKKLTFKQLYGGIEEKYEHIKYFNRLKDFINSQWDIFEKKGHIETSFFRRKITKFHISDPSPSKLFNYLLQASETEIAILTLNKINCFLKDKKTKPVLYTYDSFLYDFCKEDGVDTLRELINIQKNDCFPVKCYVGNSYGSVKFEKLLN